MKQLQLTFKQDGKALILDLSQLLTKKYGEGFSTTNLWYFRQFYLAFQNRKPKILHPLGGESLDGFSANLSWSHYRALR